MFGALSARFTWTPEQIGNLTMPQFTGYCHYLNRHPAPFVFLAEPR